MKTLYFDCATGISGNMTIGALLEICNGEQYLRDELAKLRVPGYELNVVKRDSHGIDGTYVEVLEANTGLPVDAIYEDSHNRNCSATLEPDHGHAHSYNHEHESDSDHNYGGHNHEHEHVHEHSFEHHSYNHHNHKHGHAHDHSHNHVHRIYGDIRQIIDSSGITEASKVLSKSMFHKVAVAEAQRRPCTASR